MSRYIEDEINYCPNCGSSDIDKYYDNRANGYLHEFIEMRCDECGGEYRITETEFEEIGEKNEI